MPLPSISCLVGTHLGAPARPRETKPRVHSKPGTPSTRPDGLTVTLYSVIYLLMDSVLSAEQLAAQVNGWCERHEVEPASGQAGERMTERNIRYYRTLGLIDPAGLGGGQGFGEKHRLQLIAIRLLQTQGVPLNRIRELLFGRSIEELRRIEKQGLAELKAAQIATFRPSAAQETWRVTPLDDDFMIVSRRGRGLSHELRERILGVLNPNPKELTSRAGGKRKES